jgi:hypothetical protein
MADKTFPYTCIDCIFWEEDDSSGLFRKGICYGLPPTLIVIDTSSGQEVYQHRPMTEGSDSCSLHNTGGEKK